MKGKVFGKIIVLFIVIIAAIIAFVCMTKTNEDKPTVGDENLNLVYETTVSPNEDFVAKDEDKVIYTIKVYQDDDIIKVAASSNSAFFEDISYEIKSDNKITEKDVNTEWQTIMGDTNFTEENQLVVAVVSISSNGEVISQRKINFINKAVDIIVDTVNGNL